MRFGTTQATPEMEESYSESYTSLRKALNDKNLTGSEVDEVLALTEWAKEDLNLRPHAYQACALTT